MSNMRIYDAFRNTPEEAKKTIKGGRISGFTDINPMYRIQRLTEQYGPCGIGWYYEPVKKWTEQAGEEILCFVDINLYVKEGGEWSKPIPGTGGSTLLAKESKGLRASDEGFKMATTDALSVACKQLGIGADVYWAAGETKYSQVAPETRADRINKMCLHHSISVDTFGEYLKALQDEGKVARTTVKKMKDDEFVQMLGAVHEALQQTKEKPA